MQLLKRIKWIYVLLSVFLAGLGVCLLLWPDIPSITICCAVGGGAVLFGIVKIVMYFLHDLEAMDQQNDFAIGAMCVIAGVILLIHPDTILDMIPQVLGVFLLIDCMFKLQIALDACRLGSKSWWLMLIVTMLCLGWSCLLIWQPFGLENYKGLLIAVGLIADGVQNLMGVIYIAATVKKTEATGKEITEPAEPLTPPVFAAADTPVITTAPSVPVIPVAPAAEESPAPAVTPEEPPAEEPEPKPDAPAPAQEKKPKKKFSLFGKKETPADPEPPLTPPDFSAQAEDSEEDGAVTEINFEVKENEVTSHE